MKKRILIVSVLLSIMFSSISLISVSADSAVLSNEGIEQPTVDWNEVIGDNPSLNTDEFYDFSKLLDASAYNQLKYEVPSSVSSVSRLNTEYELLSLKMDDFGYGTLYQIEIPEFKPGYASDITQEFKKTFGDLSGKAVTEMTMPEGWTVSSIMENASEQRESLVSDYKNSQAYTEMYNTINTSQIFKLANQTMTMPSTSSLSSLAGKLSSVNSPYSISGAINNAKNEYLSKVNNSTSVGDLTKKYNNGKANVDIWISNNKATSGELAERANSALFNNDVARNIYNDYLYNSNLWSELEKYWATDPVMQPLEPNPEPVDPDGNYYSSDKQVSYALGDANRDGCINNKDASFINKNYVLGSQDSPYEYRKEADFNCDGVIDESDATAIQKSIAALN